MNRWILACAAVLLTAGVYLLVAGSRDEPPAGSPRTAIRIVAAPSAAPPALDRREPARLVVTGETLRPAKSAAVEAESGDDQTASGPQLTGEEMRAQLDVSFAGDPPVAASQDRTPDLAQRLTTVLPAGSSVRSIECRASLCRIETAHASVAEFQELAQSGYLTLDLARRISNGPVLVALQTPAVEGQPVVGVAFLGREGGTLPGFTAATTSSGR